MRIDSVLYRKIIVLRYVVDDGHSVMKEPMKDKRIIPVERIILLCFIGPECRGCNP